MTQHKPAQSVRPGGLSLYANLLDTSSNKDSNPGTISRAPVVFKHGGDDPQQDRAAAEKQINAASLRFQPTKRPQLAAQKPKAKTSLQKPSAPAPTPPPPPSAPNGLDSIDASSRAPAKTTLADWTAEGDEHDVNGFYAGEKRQRGGRKKRKKNKEESHLVQNWDDIYDPSRPNNYEDYKHSDEKILEIREWKNKLYAHRMARRRNSSSGSSSDEGRPAINKQFAPPPMSFAPPPSFDDNGKIGEDVRDVTVANDSIREDAYASRLRLSGLDNPNLPSEPVNVSDQVNPIVNLSTPGEGVSRRLKPSPPLVLPAKPGQSISRAPVRYNLPAPPPEIPASEAELESALQTDPDEEETTMETAPRSLRPGQKGFAERLMSKYGWSKGSGLGASGSGIVNPLRVQVEKQKKKPDSEGGGFVGPGGRGKIIGGKKTGGSGTQSQEGKFGSMSEVIVLRGMVDGMDLDAEMEASGEGGLMQEIGEECGEKYGRVERVFIDRTDSSKAPVFVKFTSQLSALRAVNALEGRIFNGNTILARFFDADKFESGIYE